MYQVKTTIQKGSLIIGDTLGLHGKTTLDSISQYYLEQGAKLLSCTVERKDCEHLNKYGKCSNMASINCGRVCQIMEGCDDYS